MIVHGTLVGHISKTKELHSNYCIHEHQKNQKHAQTSHRRSSFSQRVKDNLYSLSSSHNFQQPANSQRPQNCCLNSEVSKIEESYNQDNKCCHNNYEVEDIPSFVEISLVHRCELEDGLDGEDRHEEVVDSVGSLVN